MLQGQLLLRQCQHPWGSWKLKGSCSQCTANAAGWWSWAPRHGPSVALLHSQMLLMGVGRVATLEQSRQEEAAQEHCWWTGQAVHYSELAELGRCEAQHLPRGRETAGKDASGGAVPGHPTSTLVLERCPGRVAACRGAAGAPAQHPA